MWWRWCQDSLIPLEAKLTYSQKNGLLAKHLAPIPFETESLTDLIKFLVENENPCMYIFNI